MKTLRKITRTGREVGRYFADGHVRLAPFVVTLGKYNFEKLRADAHAAANVTLLGLPQSIAYATIAGLPIVYGILSSAVAAIVAPLFAASRNTVLGPTNATAFMLFSFFSMHPMLVGRYAELIPLLVMMSGLMAVVGSALRVADLLQYVSRSVLVGYIAGAAVLIIANQIKPLLGVADFMDSEATITFVGLVIELVKALPHTQWVPVLIGGVTLAVYFSIRKWKPSWPAFALTLIIASAAFGTLIQFGVGPFKAAETFTTFGFEDLKPGFPNFSRSTIFSDISSLIAVAFAIAFLASLENSLMSKTLASRSGERPDPNQDMLSVGMANLATSIAGGMPASGSLTRSSLNFESGARTRFSSLYSGIYTLAIAVLIAASVDWGVPIIDYVPKAALAALVIALSFSLFNLRHIRICLHSTRDDAAVLITTFIATLLAPLHVAIFIGVAVSISLFLRKASRPHLVEYEFSEEGELREMGEKRQRPIPAISIVHVEGDLFFGAAELFRTQIQRTVSDPAIQVIILRLKNARHLDATSVMALEDLIRFMRDKGLHLIVSGASRDVYRVLKQSGVLLTLQEGCDRRTGESNLFLTNPRNPNLSTRGALKRAQQVLGTDKADIRIFYDPSQPSKS
ncbi:MAG: SulP family inorganic anion transporter [Luteolibacter sp.]|jgi:SulP family sulfate permease|nr:SulP family inorganic anion transporter [Luteolibacter sp.]